MVVRILSRAASVCLFISLSLSLSGASPPAVWKIEVMDINNTLELRSRPRTYQPVCVLEAKNAADRRFINEIGKAYGPIFSHRDWSSFGPDSRYRRIRLVIKGKMLTLQSWHPIYEKEPRIVVTSHGVSSLNGRTRAEVLIEDDSDYVARRTAFDAIVEQCLARLKARKK